MTDGGDRETAAEQTSGSDRREERASERYVQPLQITRPMSTLKPIHRLQAYGCSLDDAERAVVC